MIASRIACIKLRSVTYCLTTRQFGLVPESEMVSNKIEINE